MGVLAKIYLLQVIPRQRQGIKLNYKTANFYTEKYKKSKVNSNTYMFNVYKNIPNYNKKYPNYKIKVEYNMYTLSLKGLWTSLKISLHYVHVQFTTLPFKPLPHQKSEVIPSFLSLD